eukprot:5943176-Lingulodinium_polyedra.AAC.1
MRPDAGARRALAELKRPGAGAPAPARAPVPGTNGLAPHSVPSHLRSGARTHFAMASDRALRRASGPSPWP